MKLVNLKQDAPEWPMWRKGRVTASDVSALFGKNPYKTEWKLWAEKSGHQAEDDPGGNPYVRRGKSCEPLVRQHLSTRQKLSLIPCCVESDSYPHLAASLDGLDRSKRPWELKIPSDENFEKVKQLREKSEPYQQYYYQVQHQLLVTGAHEGFLVFAKLSDDDSPEPTHVVETVDFVILPDAALHKEIIDRVSAFMLKVQNAIEPDKDPDRDVFSPVTEDDAKLWSNAAQDILPLLAQRTKLKEQLSELEERINSEIPKVSAILGNYKAGAFGGLHITRVDRIGHIDWPALAAKAGVDVSDTSVVDKFRKPSTTSFKLRAI